mmetsp:Transcript_10805/g.17633  ORF Transcript_10805/g.17633 Transcript_10805/m.17633 type:complete len:330 (+) Transcript_10805:125-1114(+)
MPSPLEMGGLTPEMAAFMNAVQSRLDEQDTKIAARDAKIEEQGATIKEQGAKLGEQDTKIAARDAKLEEQGAKLDELRKEFDTNKRNARFRILCTSLKHALRCWENQLQHCYNKALQELQNTDLGEVKYYMFVSILRHQKQRQSSVPKPLTDFVRRILGKMVILYNKFEPKRRVDVYILSWIIIDVTDVRFKLNDEHHDIPEKFLVDEGFGSLLDQVFQVDQEMVLDKGLFILDKTHMSSKKLNDSVNIFVSNRCTIPVNLAWNDIKQFQVRVAALGRFLDHLSNPGGTPRIPYQAVKDNIKAEKPPKINFNTQYTGVVNYFKTHKLIK